MSPLTPTMKCGVCPSHQVSAAHSVKTEVSECGIGRVSCVYVYGFLPKESKLFCMNYAPYSLCCLAQPAAARVPTMYYVQSETTLKSFREHSSVATPRRGFPAEASAHQATACAQRQASHRSGSSVPAGASHILGPFCLSQRGTGSEAEEMTDGFRGTG